MLAGISKLNQGTKTNDMRDEHHYRYVPEITVIDLSCGSNYSEISIKSESEVQHKRSVNYNSDLRLCFVLFDKDFE